MGACLAFALVAGGVGLVRLRHDHLAALATSARLNEFSARLSAINAAEWQAVAAAPWRVTDPNTGDRERAAEELVSALPGDLPERPVIVERFRAYSLGLEAERRAIAERDIDGAVRIDREVVAPAFQALGMAIDHASGHLGERLDASIRRADGLAMLVLVAAAGAAGLLLWLRVVQLGHGRALDQTALVLRRKEAELNEAQRVAHIGSWDRVLETGEIVWSDELRRMFGVDPSLPVSGFDGLRRFYPEDSWARLRAAVEKAVQTGALIDLDVEIVRADGNIIWGATRGEAVRDATGRIIGTRGTIQDITDRKQTEAQLRRREAILSAVSMTAERFLQTATWRTSIVEVLAALGNAAGADRVAIFERAAEQTQDAVVSQRYEWCGPGLTPVGGHPEVEDVPVRAMGFARWADLLGRGETLAGAVRDLPPEEQPVLAAYGVRSFAVVPVFVGSEWWGFISVNACAEERTWSRAELDALSAAARLLGEAVRRERDDESRARLESQLLNAQKMEALGQLAGGVAHDFNNLLTVILGNASRLDDTALGETETRRLAAAITNAGTRAARLTAQLLALGRRQPMQRRQLDLNTVVETDVAMLGRLLGELITVRTRYGTGLPLVHADEGMVGQVIMNLAVNARDAMPGGGTLTIATESVEVRAGDGAGALFDRQTVVLSVSDTGCGMDHVTQAHIFEPFFTTKAFGQGTGLGLATVYGIVKQHDGWIEVQSEPGQGSTFKVFLPAALEQGERESPVEPKAPARAEAGSILLVEDEPEVREVAAALLRRNGYEVVEAGSGPEALEAWRDCAQRADLLFTDMVMTPGMSGRDLAAALRLERPDLKVIICSGYNQEPIAPTAAHSARDGFLQKPFTSAGLLDAVRRQLSESG